MAISVANQQMIKDLLLLPGPELDTLVAAEWEQQLAVLTREYDFFVSPLVLNTTIGQSIYTLPPSTARISSVIFRGVALGYTDAGTLNLRNADWELAIPSTPLYWSYNIVPPHADVPAAVVSPREFLITPAPDGAQAGPATLRLYIHEIPSLPPAWVEPILVYRVTAHLAGQNPNLVQPEKGEFFTTLADGWLQYARQKIQI